MPTISIGPYVGGVAAPPERRRGGGGFLRRRGLSEKDATRLEAKEEVRHRRRLKERKSEQEWRWRREDKLAEEQRERDRRGRVLRLVEEHDEYQRERRDKLQDRELDELERRMKDLRAQRTALEKPDSETDKRLWEAAEERQQRITDRQTATREHAGELEKITAREEAKPPATRFATGTEEAAWSTVLNDEIKSLQEMRWDLEERAAKPPGAVASEVPIMLEKVKDALAEKEAERKAFLRGEKDPPTGMQRGAAGAAAALIGARGGQPSALPTGPAAAEALVGRPGAPMPTTGKAPYEPWKGAPYYSKTSRLYAPPVQQGRIRVRIKATGQTGTIPIEDFDPATMERI